MLEVYIRRFYPQNTFSFIEEQSFGCYQLSSIFPYEYQLNCIDEAKMGEKEFVIRINNVGLRGRDIGDKGGRRILLTGDSFVFGYGVEDSEKMGSILEDSLSDTEVVSAGFMGDAGPDTAYMYLLKNFKELKPDKIIVALFPYNDLSDIAKTEWKEDGWEIFSVSMPDKWVDKEGYLRYKDTPWRYRIPILRNSHLYQFLIERIDVVSKNWRQKIAIRLGWIDKGNNEYRKFEACLYEADCEDKWEVAQGKIKLVMENFESFSEKNDIPIGVVIIPLKEQLAGEKPQKTIFHEEAAAAGLPILDLSEALKSGDIESEYLPDGHFSAEGNRIAAEAVRDWIQTLQFPRNDY